MTDPASIAEEDYDEHEWYVAKSLPSAFNGYATGFFACTDKAPTNAIRIAHADTHLAAMAIVDALSNQRDADLAYNEAIQVCRAMAAENAQLEAALDAAQDKQNEINAYNDTLLAITADRDHLVTQLAGVHSELARVTAQPDALRNALIDTLGYVPVAMRDKLVKMLGYDFESEPEAARSTEPQLRAARKAVIDAADALTQHKVQSSEWNAAYVILRRATIALAEIERQAS